MASKYSVELSLDTKGYTDGAKQAEDANADFVSSLGNVTKKLPNLRKELGASRREVTALALAYARLSDTEKKSAFGQQLSRQLEDAKKKTAELIDLNADLSQELKNMASDTATWDAMKEGIGVVKDGMTALITTTADLTGKTEDLAPVIKKIAQVQSIASTAISVGNALQKQSAIMCGIRRVQELALAAAIKQEAASTGAATVAQRIFNTVAKANPYVLLATAIIAVATALGTYMLATRKTVTEEQKLQEELRKEQAAWKAKEASVNESVASSLADYYKLAAQWKMLSSEHQKNKWIEENSNKFKSMGLNIDGVRAAEEAFVNNTAAVVSAIKARAEAEAWGEVYKEHMTKKIKDDLNGTIANGRYYARAKAGDIISDEEAKALGIVNKIYNTMSTSAGTYIQTLDRQITAEEAERVNIYRNAEAAKKLNKERQEGVKIMEGMTKAEERAAHAEAKLGNLSTANILSPKDRKPGKDGKSSKNEIQATEGSIESLEKEITDLQDKLKKGLIPEKDINSTLETIKNLQDQVKELKIKYNFESADKAKTKLKQLEEELDKQTKAYEIAVDANDDEARQAALKAIYEAQEELDKHKALLTIEPRTTEKEKRKIQKEVSDIVEKALKPDVEYDFDALKDKLPDKTKEAVDQTLKEYNRLKEARIELLQIISNEDSSDPAIAAAQEGLDKLDAKWKQVTEDVKLYNQANEEIKVANESTEELARTVDKVGAAVNATSQLFGALGEISGDNTMQAMAIVGQAIATIALSFAKALTTAKTWVDWLAFGATGLATMASMIKQVKSLTAGSYAGGGIVGGSSYYGDRMTANVNSGEMILNRRHQKNLFDAIDKNKLGGGNQQIRITGVIRGKDLLLVQKNANSVLGKAGQNITIG